MWSDNGLGRPQEMNFFSSFESSVKNDWLEEEEELKQTMSSNNHQNLVSNDPKSNNCEVKKNSRPIPISGEFIKPLDLTKTMTEVEVVETLEFRPLSTKPRVRRTSDVIDSIGDKPPDSPRSRNSSQSSPWSREGSWSQESPLGSPRLKNISTNGVSKSPPYGKQGSESPRTPDTGYSANSLSGTFSPGSADSFGSVDRVISDEIDAKLAIPTLDAQPMEAQDFTIKSEADVPEASMPVHRDAHEYNMNHKRRGKAVIFNHDEFELKETRLGSHMDVENLNHVFSGLGFQVEIHNNLEFVEIKGIISKLAMEDHSDADCLLVTVLTHGMDNGYLHSKDSVYSVEKLWMPFTAEKCQTLAGKPKIFIIQACRGQELDSGVKLVERRMRFYSFRNPEEGTWFIRCLCAELKESGATTDFLKVLTRAARRVALEHESYNDMDTMMHEKKQVPSTVSMLIRDIYFRPKS
uniref:(California timema) hypothetical protein n=1 Tax=Timema californicum TaxID=61474 RepID=A0A7R9PAJ2_TIMCA|nr:unnamed protein product [Timema californicum]